jgi:hypothetical protein
MANPTNSVFQPQNNSTSQLNFIASTQNDRIAPKKITKLYVNPECDILPPIKKDLNNEDNLKKLTSTTPKSIYITASTNTQNILNSISNYIDFIETQIVHIPNDDKEIIESLTLMLFSKIKDLAYKAQQNHADISSEIEEKINTICNRTRYLLNILMIKHSETNDFSLYVNCIKHLNFILILKHESEAIIDCIYNSSFIDKIAKITSDTNSNQDEYKISLLSNLSALRNLVVTSKFHQQDDTNPIKLNTSSKIYSPETTTLPSLDIATIQYSRLMGQTNIATNLILASRKQILGTENNTYKNYKIASGNFNLDMELIKLLFTLGNVELTQILYDDIFKNNLQQDIIPLGDLTQEITKDLTNIIDNFFAYNDEYTQLDEITEVETILPLLQYHPKNMISYASLYPDTQVNKNIIYNALSYYYTFIKYDPTIYNWKDKLQYFNLITQHYIPTLFPNIKSFALSYEDANRIRFASKKLNIATNIQDKYKNKIEEFHKIDIATIDYIESIEAIAT